MWFFCAKLILYRLSMLQIVTDMMKTLNTTQKKRELNSSPFSNVNPQTHNVRSVSDVKCGKGKNYPYCNNYCNENVAFFSKYG